MKNAAKKDGDVKVAIIPFDTTVNLGTSYKDNDWFDIDSIDCNGWKTGSGCNSANWKDNWEGCVRDRTYPYDTQRRPRPTTTGQEHFPVYDCGSLAKLMPLTTNWTALNSKVDEMTPNGNTNVTIGLAWGCHALTPSAPLSEASAPRARSRQGHHPPDRRRQHGSLEKPNNTKVTTHEPDRRAHQARLRQHQGGRISRSIRSA